MRGGREVASLVDWVILTLWEMVWLVGGLISLRCCEGG